MKPSISSAELQCRRVHDAGSLTIAPIPHKRSRWENCLAQTWGNGNRPEWQLADGICKGCACEIDTTPLQAVIGDAHIIIPSTVCDDCMELVRDHYDPHRAENQEVTQTPKWDEKCPVRHAQVVLGETRPSSIDWNAFGKVLEWTPDTGRGLIMVGPPGTGKSSAFWALARQMEANGITPVVVGSVELGRILGNAAKDINEVGWLYRTRVLMIDDLGKERASPGVAALFWEVLDRRLSNNLPCIFTSNHTGESFAARFGEPELGNAIRRRISELCKMINFAPKDNQSHG